VCCKHNISINNNNDYRNHKQNQTDNPIPARRIEVLIINLSISVLKNVQSDFSIEYFLYEGFRWVVCRLHVC